MSWDDRYHPYQFSKRHKSKIILLVIVLISLIIDIFQPGIYQGILGQYQSTNSNQAPDFLGNSSQRELTVNQTRFIGTWENTTLGMDTVFIFTNDTLVVEGSLGSQYSTYEISDYKTFIMTTDGQSENVSYGFLNDNVLLIDYQGAVITLNKIG
jgi:hypothetical protein